MMTLRAWRWWRGSTTVVIEFATGALLCKLMYWLNKDMGWAFVCQLILGFLEL